MTDDTKVCPALNLKESDQAENQEEDRIMRHAFKKVPPSDRPGTDNKFGFWLGTASIHLTLNFLPIFPIIS